MHLNSLITTCKINESSICEGVVQEKKLDEGKYIKLQESLAGIFRSKPIDFLKAKNFSGVIKQIEQKNLNYPKEKIQKLVSEVVIEVRRRLILEQTERLSLLNFQEFFINNNLEEQLELLNLVKEVANKNPVFIVHALEKFNMELWPEEKKLEIIIDLVNELIDKTDEDSLNKYTSVLFMAIHKEEKIVTALAHLLAKRKPELLDHYLMFTKVVTPEEKNRIIILANQLAEDHPQEIPNFINSLKNKIDVNAEEWQKRLIDLANKVAEKEPKIFINKIASFQIQSDTERGQEALIALVYKVFEANPEDLICNIEDFGIKLWDEQKKQDVLIHLSQQMAEKCPESLINNLYKFNCQWKTEKELNHLIHIAEKIITKNKDLIISLIRKVTLRIEEPLQKDTLIKLTGLAFNALGNDLNLDDSATKTHLNNISEQLCNIRDCELRHTVFSSVIELIRKNKKEWKRFQQISFSTQSSNRTLLPNLYLVLMCSDETALLRARNIQSNRVFKNGSHYRLLVQTLQILSVSSLPVADKEYLLKEVLQFKSKCIDSLKILQTALLLNLIEPSIEEKIKKNSLGNIDSFQVAFKQLFTERFINMFPVAIDSEKVFNLFDNTFNSFRGLDALFIYNEKLKELPLEDSKILSSHLLDFIKHVLLGTFKQYRYDKTESVHLSRVFKEGQENLEFLWQQDLSCPASEVVPSLQNMELYESDDPWHLFRSGTDIDSCQSVYRSSQTNKALLAYVLDGKNRMIFLREKNAEGFKARAILRILIDKDTGIPVLFLERIYPALIKSEETKAIVVFAKIKAQKMGLRLFSEDHLGGACEGVELESDTSRALFEYVDAENKNIVTKGVFTIHPTYLNYEP